MASDCEDLQSNPAAVFIYHVLLHDMTMSHELVKPDGLKQRFPTFFHLRTPWQPISINCALHISEGMELFLRLNNEENPLRQSS